MQTVTNTGKASNLDSTGSRIVKRGVKVIPFASSLPHPVVRVSRGNCCLRGQLRDWWVACDSVQVVA